ncbi:MAG: sigma-70 family RNA polymerase sigma factor [Planctomycetaceae bacterium]|nr:sigma-70 family RNA polymerase sigma factor [Planctomycetaceae bacterium]
MSASPPSQEFIQQFTQAQRTLYLGILAQVGDVTAAEEILQDANVVLLSKHDQFESGTNFLAWARQVGAFEVLRWRQRRRRDKLRFSDEFVSVVAAEAVESEIETDRRRRALALCMEKLKSEDRELLQRRYQPGNSGKELASELGRPANSVYQSLGRIRRYLLDCVQRRMTLELG